MAKKFGKRGKKKGAPEDPRNMFGPPMPRRGGPPASSTPLADFLDRGWPGVDDGYVVLPRSLAEAMSLPWQQQTAELLSQFHGTHRGLSWPIYRVTPSRYERLVDLDEEQLAEAGYLVEIDFDGEMVYRERSGRRVENPEQTTVLVATLDPIVRRRPPAQPRPQTPAEGGSRAPVPMNLPPAPVWRTVPAKSPEAPPLPVPEPPKNVAAPPGSTAPKKPAATSDLPWEPVAKPPARPAESAAQPTSAEPAMPAAGPSTAESTTPPASTPAAESPWRATQSPWQAAMPSTAQPPVAEPQAVQPPVPVAQAPIAEPEVPKPPAAEAPVSPPLVAEPEVPVSPAPAGASAAQPPFAESPASPPSPAEPPAPQAAAAEAPASPPPVVQPPAPQPPAAEVSAPQPPAAEPPQPPAAEFQRAGEPVPPVAEQPPAETRQPPAEQPQPSQESAVSTSGRLPVVPPSTARLVTELDEPLAVPSPVVEVDPDTDTPPRGTRLPIGGDRGWFDELPDSASAASSSEPPAPPEDTGFGPSGDPTEIPYRYRK
ncbi:hypothetical protein [Amycolatopsis magusensis]|uniref:hypothetical protein n=1 Tax=Amycolatopsis magusensis TaxID=882444 RepID=UPI003C2ED14A